MESYERHQYSLLVAQRSQQLLSPSRRTASTRTPIMGNSSFSEARKSPIPRFLLQERIHAIGFDERFSAAGHQHDAVSSLSFPLVNSGALFLEFGFDWCLSTRFGTKCCRSHHLGSRKVPLERLQLKSNQRVTTASLLCRCHCQLAMPMYECKKSRLSVLIDSLAKEQPTASTKNVHYCWIGASRVARVVARLTNTNTDTLLCRNGTTGDGIHGCIQLQVGGKQNTAFGSSSRLNDLLGSWAIFALETKSRRVDNRTSYQR